MDEQQYLEIKERLDALDKFVYALRDKIDGLDEIIYDEILDPLDAHIKDYEYNTKLNDFKDRSWEKLNPYMDRIKAIEGDDFDLYKQAYDEYNQMEGEKPSEEDFLNLLTEQLDAQLNRIRESLGVPADAKLVIEDGGENEEPIVTVEEAKTEEEVKEEVEKTEAPGEEEVAEDDIAAYEKELEAYKPKSQNTIVKL